MYINGEKHGTSVSSPFQRFPLGGDMPLRPALSTAGKPRKGEAPATEDIISTHHHHQISFPSSSFTSS